MTRKHAWQVVFLFVLFSFSAFDMVRADTQTIVSTIRQPFSGSQSPDEARVIAIARVKRNALEKAEPYIEALAIVRNQTIGKEEIPTLAAGILEPEIVSRKNYAADDTFGIEITVRIEMNTDIMEARITWLLKDPDLLEKYRAIRNREADLLSRIEALEAESRESEQASFEQKQDRQKKFQNLVEMLSAVAWYSKAVDLTRSLQTLNKDTATNALTTLRYLHTAIVLDPEYSAALSWLGKIYLDNGGYDKSVYYYQKALEIDLEILGEHHPDLVTAYNNLGLACHRRGDREQAVEYYQKALDIQLAALEKHPDKAIEYYNKSGLSCRHKGDYSQAVKFYKKALKLQIDTLGKDHPDVATTYNNIGETYRHKGKHKKAIEYYQKDLEITIKSLGPDHPNVATTYNNMGYAYHGLGDYNKAIEYFQKALEIYRKVLGEDHPQVKTIKDNIEFLKTRINKNA